MAKYIVTSTTKSGKRISSQMYDTKAAAEAHCSNTKKNWKHMYKNPRVKRIL